MTKILVIDDDSAIQLLLKRTLATQGYSVVLASDGEKGLKLAFELHPAMVICDWVMPGMSGIDVCRKIKATPELATTFFILLTSLGSVSDRVKGLDAGADDFLCKPIDMYELKARVRAGLRLHQLNHDLKLQKQLLESELAEAAEYVNSILPEPALEPPIAIDLHFLPSRQLGGDGFDYYWLDREHLVIYLLDVSGHGLRAALPSLSVINLLRSRSLTKVNYYKPSEVLQRLNESFQMTARNDKYFTIWYGVYNSRSRELIYASAGHPPAILFSEGDRRQKRLKTSGFPVGMFLDAEYADACCQIDSGASLYIFSDGIYEIDRGNGNIWSLDEFISLLEDYQKGSDRSVKNLVERIKIHNNNYNLEDDLSVIQITFY
ncbi:MAG: SpoIIE family protein phosphatase [Prochloraceae cyanobacterium]|nr:SpoIIE family protein phosphatase [Prochloraceae cyanobacterium]